MMHAGKVALVTGASKGIGRGVAAWLAREGAQVIATGRNGSELDSLVKEVSGAPGEVCPLVLDASDPEAIRSAVSSIPQHFGGEIDYLVNNAGVAHNAPFLEATMEDLDRTLAINVKAPVVFTQVVAASLIARGVPGAVVNVSSQASMVGLADHTAYCASKGAMDQLTRVMA